MAAHLRVESVPIIPWNTHVGHLGGRGDYRGQGIKAVGHLEGDKGDVGIGLVCFESAANAGSRATGATPVAAAVTASAAVMSLSRCKVMNNLRRVSGGIAARMSSGLG